MKIELVTFMASQNGIMVRLIGETEQETDLLKGLGKHGKLDVRDAKLCIDWKFEPEKQS